MVVDHVSGDKLDNSVSNLDPLESEDARGENNRRAYGPSREPWSGKSREVLFCLARAGASSYLP